LIPPSLAKVECKKIASILWLVNFVFLHFLLANTQSLIPHTNSKFSNFYHQLQRISSNVFSSLPIFLYTGENIGTYSLLLMIKFWKFWIHMWNWSVRISKQKWRNTKLNNHKIWGNYLHLPLDGREHWFSLKAQLHWAQNILVD